MNPVISYIVATLLAVVGGWVGYYLVPFEPFGVVGNTLFVGAVFGVLMGFVRAAGFLGNVINAFIVSFPLWYILPGNWFIIWTGGNAGCAFGNVLGQLVALSVENKIEAKAL
jgi:hypothetical protein